MWNLHVKECSLRLNSHGFYMSSRALSEKIFIESCGPLLLTVLGILIYTFGEPLIHTLVPMPPLLLVHIRILHR